MSSSWDSTAPIPTSLASVSRTNCNVKSGNSKWVKKSISSVTQQKMFGSLTSIEMLHFFPLGNAVVWLDQKNHELISCSNLPAQETVVTPLQLSVLASSPLCLSWWGSESHHLWRQHVQGTSPDAEENYIFWSFNFKPADLKQSKTTCRFPDRWKRID